MTAIEGTPAITSPVETPRALRRRVIRRLRRNPLALSGFAILSIFTIAALLAPLIAPYDPTDAHFDDSFTTPGGGRYLLGTDDLGRDILSRIIHGTRASLGVGIMSVALALVIGVPLGLAAGYFRKLDGLISRITDLVLAFPFLILAVGLTTIRGPSLTNAALAIGIAQVPTMIRVTRSETLRLSALDYVAAAIVGGAGNLWVLARHVLPNATSAIIVQATILIPGAILGEAVLSFLGLGIRPPAPSLGTMLADAQTYSSQAPWTAVIPGVAIMLLVLAFNVFGDGLRDAFDPKASRR